MSESVLQTTFCLINETIYNSHVKKYSKFSEMEKPFLVLDFTLGSLLILCTIVGVIGNTLACFFFSSKSRRDLVTCLYIVINVTDIVCSFTHLPVTVSLLRCRTPGIFNNYLFCALWETVFCIMQKFSIYLVLLLSITRTIAIVKPFYKIKSKSVLYSLLLYLVLLTIFPILQYCITSLRGEFKFSWEGAYCYYNFKLKFEHIINLILVGMPPIITFATFVLSLTKLHTSAKLKACSQRKNSMFKERGKHRASITIAMFTGIFLMCNLPYFINLVQNMTTTFMGVKYPGAYFSSRFMYWYSWHIAKIDSVVMNAALNPVLYLCRMKRFRAWLVVLSQCKRVRVEDLNDTMSPNLPYAESVAYLKHRRSSVEATLRSMQVVSTTTLTRLRSQHLITASKETNSLTANGLLGNRHNTETLIKTSLGTTKETAFDDSTESFRNWGQLSQVIDTKVDTL